MTEAAGKIGCLHRSGAPKASPANVAVIANGTYGAGVRHSSGLSVWFPAEPQLYLNFRAKYVALDFFKNYTAVVDVWQHDASIAAEPGLKRNVS